MTQVSKEPKHYPFLRNLQFSPIKEQGEQYVLLWDPTGLSTEKLIVPLSYFFLLQHFDGSHSLDDLAGLYLKKFGEFLVPDRIMKLVGDLEDKLFLEGDRLEEVKSAARAAFRDAPLRKSAFAGKSYPEDKNQLVAQLDSFFTSKEGPEINPSPNQGKKIRGIVAPHFEMREAGSVYAWAYKELKEAQPADLFVMVGTCHSGLESLFALTDKDFETPLGIARTDKEVLDRFRQHRDGSFFEEELSHQHDHTIELQLPFLQHAMGIKNPISIVPVLCAFPPSYVIDPEYRAMRDRIEGFVQTMKEALAASGKEVCIVASAELAHMGLRYGDAEPPTDFSFHRCMQTDLEMLKHVEDVNPEAFAQFIEKEDNRRNIWGFAPIYTLLRLIEGGKGQVLRYDRGITDQYNSTATYASMAFF